MYAQRVEVLHIADRDAVVIPVAHHLILDLLPSFQRFFYQHLRRIGECLACLDVKFCLVVAETAAKAAEGVGRAQDHRIAYLTGRPAGLPHTFHSVGTYDADTDFFHTVCKRIPVFGIHYGLHRCSKHAHSVFLKDAAAVEFHAAVQGGLPAEGQHYAVWPLLLYHLFHEEWRHRQQIDAVGNSFGCLDRGYVGIDQDCRYPFFGQCLQGLAAAVVEFSGLTYLEGSGSEQEHFVESSHSVDTKRLNKYIVSRGPLEASGWNCTEKKGLLRCLMPSFVPSFRFMKRGSQSDGRVFSSTA